MTNVDRVKEYVERHRHDIVRFTSELISIQSLTGSEGRVAQSVKAKMEELGYDSVKIDELGNVIGLIGQGTPDILFDSHMDTVTVTDEELWSFDPYSGDIIDGFVCGRGAVDMKGGLASSIYAGAAVKALGFALDKTVCVVASVMEEDYDGEALYHICSNPLYRPKRVVICEPSSLHLALGHRGRALIRIKTEGVAAHGSAPEQGVNAIYKMQPIIARVESLSCMFIDSPQYQGSVTLSVIESTSVSANAVPSSCEVLLDRRLGLIEDRSYIEKEMKDLLMGTDASWEIVRVEGVSWTGGKVVLESFLPAWESSDGSYFTKLGQLAYETLFRKTPDHFFWDFCTNGVTSAGKLGIPTIGFGPGLPELAHKRDERCSIDEILKATEFYGILCSF